MPPKELDNSLFVLEARHIDVEIHPVDALNCELYMTGEDLGYGLC
jgi:hypothetical protein